MRFTTLRYTKEVTKQLRESVYAKCNSCYLSGSFLYSLVMMGCNAVSTQVLKQCIQC